MTLPTLNNSTTAVDNDEILTLTVPTGVAIGQLALIIVANDSTATDPQWPSPPTGFTDVDQFAGNQAISAAAFYRVVDGTEGWAGGSSTVDVTAANDAAGHVGFFLLWDDVDTTTPIDVVGIANDSPFASGTLTLDGVTTTTDDCVAIVVAASDGSDGTLAITQADWIESTQIDEPGTSTGSSLMYATESLASQGTSADATITYTPTDGRVGLIFAIRGSSATGSTLTMELAARNYFGVDLTFSQSAQLDLASSQYSADDVDFAVSISMDFGTRNYSAGDLGLSHAFLIDSAAYQYSVQDVGFVQVMGAEVGSRQYSGADLSFLLSLSVENGSRVYSGGDIEFSTDSSITFENAARQYSGGSLNLIASIAIESGDNQYHGSDASFSQSIIVEGWAMSYDFAALNLSSGFTLEQAARNYAGANIEFSSDLIIILDQAQRSYSFSDINISVTGSIVDESRFVVVSQENRFVLVDTDSRFIN